MKKFDGIVFGVDGSPAGAAKSEADLAAEEMALFEQARKTLGV